MDADRADGAGGLTPQQAFGVVLRELRQARGVSQEQLGLEVGFHRTYVSLLERGLKSPSLSALFELAATLGITPSELVRRVEARTVPDYRRDRASRRHDGPRPRRR